jgi:hypothetical protein
MNMPEPKHIDIVGRAYALWQEAGECEGRDEEFYLQAQEELRKREEAKSVEHYQETDHRSQQDRNG